MGSASTSVGIEHEPLSVWVAGTLMLIRAAKTVGMKVVDVVS